ncbi:divalent metal cation transporter [Akkermansiaceae bacterium]|nr:divalent metal cation transporter [Akkermansiaceae bacterium]MDB4667836.1 divalent metal cation transporter [Akkermansiaceae bacterium]
MSDQSQRELDVIESVANKGGITKFFAYARISGPGWLQGAITLGGGSLAGALYLGVLSGYGFLWVQPLAMICGIIMLSAIAYVVLSTQQRPLQLINQHLHPLLGWSWVIATIMANIVWTMPQFALGTAAIQQNLFSDSINQWLIIAVFFAIGLYVNYLYQSEGGGAKLFDRIIKVMVAIIVLSFFAVVISLGSTLPWGEIFAGYIPNFSLLSSPADSYKPLIAASSNPEWWEGLLLSKQKDVLFTAFGTAVGINMTFLLPYTLLKKKWGPKHRGLSITDLSIGLFVPFFIATSCVVIAAASSFHGSTEGLPEGAGTKTLLNVPSIEKSILEFKGDDDAKKIFTDTAIAALPEADRQIAAMMEKRDTKSLAVTLAPFTGDVVAQKIFGIGVLGMAVSTIIILMLINGLAFQELFGGGVTAKAASGSVNLASPYFLGCLVSGLAGCMFPFLWKGDSLAALAVPTSVIGGALLPIAYFTFFLMMNSKKILGDKRPEGTSRIIWNILMIFATSMATIGSFTAVSHKRAFDLPIGMIGMWFLVILFVVGTVSFFIKEKRA